MLLYIMKMFFLPSVNTSKICQGNYNSASSYCTSNNLYYWTNGVKWKTLMEMLNF